LVVATVCSLAQLYAGDRSAEEVARNQPAKLAAMEGHFDSSAAAPMYIFGWVNKQKEKTTGLHIPGGLSFLVHRSFNAPITGLRAFKPEDRPGQVNAVFQFYHLMIAIGVILIVLTLYACWQWRKGKLFDKRWLLIAFTWSVWLPQLANQFGWFTAEMGRQPWVVYGLLRTPDALSREVQASQVLISLILFTLVYVTLFILFLYMMNRKIKRGPEYHMSHEDEQAEHFGFKENSMVRTR
jgi:cytochrome bd ubiquinol oxidase subunit I